MTKTKLFWIVIGIGFVGLLGWNKASVTNTGMPNPMDVCRDVSQQAAYEGVEAGYLITTGMYNEYQHRVYADCLRTYKW